MAKLEIPVEKMAGLVGKEVAIGDWIEISQDRIDQFADATDDHQWIHIDTERAAKESPFKTTIGHGFLSLSMLSKMSHDTVRVKGNFKMGINYGAEQGTLPGAGTVGIQAPRPFRCAGFRRARLGRSDDLANYSRARRIPKTGRGSRMAYARILLARISHHVARALSVRRA